MVASAYALEAPSVMLKFSQHAVAWANPGPDARVLDVAAGTGMTTLEVAPRVAHVDALDFSANMLAELNRRRMQLALHNITTVHGDGQNLPFRDESYDHAFSMFGLMFFPNRLAGFCELFRTLKPDGTAIVSSWAPVDQSPLMQLIFGALRAADPSREAPQTNWLSLENPELFREEMKSAGFRDVVIKPVTHEVSIESPEAYWEATVRWAAPLALLRSRLGEAEWQRQSVLAKDYVASVVESPRTFATTAFLGFGRK
jgi:ubiquinone/menaquinone biosynthesis C-methylase UbiE